MNLIVVVDQNWGIGKENDLLFRLPLDMKENFVKKTTGQIVVMGRKTLESFPGQRPLKNRVNIVLTRDESYQKEGVILCHTFDEAVATAQKAAKAQDKTIYVIGGGSIYAGLLPFCDTAYITKVSADGNADVFFPNLDMAEDWECINHGEELIDNGYRIRFCTYKRQQI